MPRDHPFGALSLHPASAGQQEPSTAPLTRSPRCTTARAALFLGGAVEEKLTQSLRCVWPVTPVWQGLNLFHWQTPSQPTFFTSQEAFKITQFMFMNSVKQSPVQQTGSLQASPHQFCSWLSERCDCQQQDPHSASVALEKDLFFFLLQSRDLRHFHKRTEGAERESGTTKFRKEYKLQMHNMNWTARNKISTALSNQKAANNPGSLLPTDLHKFWKRTSKKHYDVIFPYICLVLTHLLLLCQHLQPFGPEEKH